MRGKIFNVFDDSISKNVKQIEQAKIDRSIHTERLERPFKFPLLWIRDKGSGRVHLYGMDTHDTLIIDDNGNLAYYNLQNGDGTGEGGGYEFVNHDTDGGIYGQILHLYLDENKVN
jgi:hypothetical protein